MLIALEKLAVAMILSIITLHFDGFLEFYHLLTVVVFKIFHEVRVLLDKSI